MGLVGQYKVSLASSDANRPDMPEEMAANLEKRILIPSSKWDQTSRRRFLHMIAAENYDLVHFHGETFAFDGHLPWRSPLHPLCLAPTPWILSNHCAPSLTESLFPPQYSLIAKFLKSTLAWASKCFLLRGCRKEIFDSDENRSQIERWFPWEKKKMTTIYHSGLEGLPPRPEVPSEVVTIGNLGHIHWRKGQQDLLKAFIPVQQKFPRLRLVLAGPTNDGDCASWIRNEINNRNLHDIVQMPGGLTDKTSFWKTTDVYVQPSQFEGAPMALMEALWQGKPAIGTRVSGIPEIIQHDVSGMLVEPGNPAAMAAAIQRLVLEADTRRRFSENGAARIQSMGMTRKDMIRNYLELYAAIFVGRKPST